MPQHSLSAGNNCTVILQINELPVTEQYSLSVLQCIPLHDDEALPQTLHEIAVYAVLRQWYPPAYMATRVIHIVNTGEIVSDAGMLIRPSPSNGTSIFRIWALLGWPPTRPAPSPTNTITVKF